VPYHTVSITLLILCFQLSSIEPSPVALSQFSIEPLTNTIWGTFLWIQAIRMYKQFGLQAIVCSLSLLYISLFGFEETLHNEVACLFFVSSLVLVFFRSIRDCLVILLCCSLALILKEGYLFAEITFFICMSVFNQLEQYRDTQLGDRKF
jgi:hypothetical protein